MLNTFVFFLFKTISLAYFAATYALSPNSFDLGNSGKVSFNGTASITECKSANNLYEIVKPEDENYKKKVCFSNLGKSEDGRCFFEIKNAKEPVEDGDQVIATGTNDGGGGGGGEGKVVKNKDGTVKRVSFPTGPEAKKEMEKKQSKSCCTKFLKYIDTGKKICIQTKGQPVNMFGQLKGGQNFGHKDRPQN